MTCGRALLVSGSTHRATLASGHGSSSGLPPLREGVLPRYAFDVAPVAARPSSWAGPRLSLTGAQDKGNALYFFLFLSSEFLKSIVHSFHAQIR